MTHIGNVTIGLLLALAPVAAGAATTPAITAAIADPGRPAADRARDADRKPAEMLAFAGVKPGMTVLEILPGGGYFTRLFSAAVGPRGTVMAYVPDEMVGASYKPLDSANKIAAEPGRGNVRVVHDPAMQDVPPDFANTLDLVWTSQNYHDILNLAGVDPIGFNGLIFKALKPGGTYVVLDHSAAAGSGISATRTLHRIDAAQVRKDVEAAGFVFAGESKLLANPADPRTAGVFDPSIRGKTDQFVYRFRKPKR
jgi:predicted methyltransferase